MKTIAVFLMAMALPALADVTLIDPSGNIIELADGEYEIVLLSPVEPPIEPPIEPPVVDGRVILNTGMSNSSRKAKSWIRNNTTGHVVVNAGKEAADYYWIEANKDAYKAHILEAISRAGLTPADITDITDNNSVNVKGKNSHYTMEQHAANWTAAMVWFHPWLDTFLPNIKRGYHTTRTSGEWCEINPAEIASRAEELILLATANVPKWSLGADHAAKTYIRTDFINDGCHPSEAGKVKTTATLNAFFSEGGPIDPPVEPPVEPPTGEYPDRAPDPVPCIAEDVGEVYPECKVTYTPQLMPRSEWTRPEFALPIHDDTSTTIILQDREPLRSALDRLYTLNPSGGIIRVPWDVDTIQCDVLNMKHSPVTKLSIIATRGPNGEMPRFYCRRGGDERFPDGTVLDGGGVFFMQGQTRDSSKNDIYTYAYIEGIHVDGYSKWFSSNTSGSLKTVGVYAHHATSNGYSSSQIRTNSKGAPQGTTLEIAGSEVSHGGGGNTEHCIYYHGSFMPGVDRALYMTGNLIHSCNWSSAIKSIADINEIDGNRLLKTLATDPTYTRRYSQYLVDAAACGNTSVRRNAITQNRPFMTTPGSAAIGSRSRKSYYGCNLPKPGGWDDTVGREIERIDSLFWEDSYWRTVNNEKTLSFEVKDNIFISSGYKADKNIAIQASGTWPNYTVTLGGAGCYFAEIPAGWSERSMVYASSNQFDNYTTSRLYDVDYPGAKIQVGDKDPCGNIWMGPDIRDFNLITVE